LFFWWYCSWKLAFTRSLMNWEIQPPAFQMAALFLHCLILNLKVSFNLIAASWCCHVYLETYKKLDLVLECLPTSAAAFPATNKICLNHAVFLPVFCWNCFSVSFASAFMPKIIYKPVLLPQSSQAYQLILSIGSFRIMLVNRTYSWLCTPRNRYNNLCSAELPRHCLVSKFVKIFSLAILYLMWERVLPKELG
jgi:hypothetical protein